MHWPPICRLAACAHSIYPPAAALQWLEGARPLGFDEMGDETFSPAIAAAMAKLHSFQVPLELEQHYTKPGMWDQLWLWYSQATAEETGAKIKARSEADAAQLAGIDLVRVSCAPRSLCALQLRFAAPSEFLVAVLALTFWHHGALTTTLRAC